jgi:hypothetical protein
MSLLGGSASQASRDPQTGTRLRDASAPRNCVPVWGVQSVNLFGEFSLCSILLRVVLHHRHPAAIRLKRPAVEIEGRWCLNEHQRLWANQLEFW